MIAGLSGARGSVEHLSRDAVRRTLMVGEIAVSFVLLVAAALLAESYLRLVNVSKGFNPDDLITACVWLPSTRYAADAAQNAPQSSWRRSVSTGSSATRSPSAGRNSASGPQSGRGRAT